MRLCVNDQRTPLNTFGVRMVAFEINRLDYQLITSLQDLYRLIYLKERYQRRKVNKVKPWN